MRKNHSVEIKTNRNKSEILRKSKTLKQSSILMAVLPLAACGGGGGGATPAANTPAPAPTPDPDFTESPTNVFIALDDSGRTLSEGGNAANLTVTGKAGNDSITTGSGADTIIGAAGNDTIISNDGNDLIRAGEGRDTVSAGSGNDAIVVVGTTSAGQYTNTDITNPAGSGTNLSNLVSLADLNSRTVSEVVSSESIDGGTGTNTLFIYGTVDLTGITLNNITVLVINSDVTLTAEQMALFTTVDGDGTSNINIEVPPGDTYIIDLSVLNITDIGNLNIDGDVTFIISDENDLDEIGAINTDSSSDVTVEINGNGGTTTVNLGALTDKFESIDKIEVEDNVVLEITDPDDLTNLGLSEISGNGEVDTGGDPDIDSAIDGIKNVNQAPDATDDFAQTIESNTVIIDVLANDTDPDQDDLTITSSVVTSGTATIQIIDNKLSVTPDSIYEVLSNNSYTEIDITYEITDGNGHTSSADITVQINGENTIINGTDGNDILDGTDGW